MELKPDVITADTFELVFKKYYKALHAYAFTILRDESQAEEIVQQVFYKLWEKRNDININLSMQAYLYRAVYNESLNYLKHLKVRKAYHAHTIHSTTDAGPGATGKMAAKELEEKIANTLRLLPEQCRTIFQMSRFEELKYREIADRLSISVKTVEHQMGKALKIMRTALAAYLPLIIYIMLLIKAFTMI